VDFPYKSIGGAIKKARKEKKLTQEKLAELIDVTSKHLQQLESGRRAPSVKVLQMLVFELDLSLNSIFSASDDELQELRDKTNICLNRLGVYELNVVYATAVALSKKELE